jgi:hypothetical protein
MLCHGHPGIDAIIRVGLRRIIESRPVATGPGRAAARRRGHGAAAPSVLRRRPGRHRRGCQPHWQARAAGPGFFQPVTWRMSVVIRVCRRRPHASSESVPVTRTRIVTSSCCPVLVSYATVSGRAFKLVPVIMIGHGARVSESRLARLGRAA